MTTINEYKTETTAEDIRLPSIHIEPVRGWVPLNLGEILAYRELIYFLIWRDVKVRYKQTVLGVLWAVLQPVFTMIVFSVIFGGLVEVDSNGYPYPIFAYAALIPWTFFAGTLGNAANSVVNSANLIRKTYFPRLVVPTASVIGGLIDFALAFIVLIVLMVIYQVYPTLTSLIWLPVFLLLAMTTSLGVALWLAAFNVRFRDIRYTIPFIIQTWLFITPVVYSSNVLADYPLLQQLYGINPMAGVVEGFRWALLGDGSAPGGLFLMSAVVSLALFISGAYYFRRMENSFADVI